ncbi:MAG TPA: MBL fold metallo-hydrolase [Methanoregula sp.]|nr:MBL fold metallo-hydrolase [Methanoregula sp.]
MPAGNDQLVSLVWQPLPGSDGAAQIFPLVRKIDTISSNSFLIQTPDALLLIDPGGLPEQGEQLMQVVAECRREKERPLYVILTHIHCDHFSAIQNIPAFAFADAATLMVQDSGACALERGDGRYTLADLFNITVRPMKVGLHILAPERKESCGIPAEICLGSGGFLTVTRIAPGSSALPDTERISFGPDTTVEFYHTPGHSVDSICIRIGGMLFVGDLFFAANPGIAGLVGWSQEELIHSLEGIGTLIGQGGVSVICPGHGRFIAAEDAIKTISLVKRDAQALTDIAELNPDRAAKAALFAEDCMEQVNELFTIMAGRLYYVSFVLEELEDEGTAAELATLIHGDAIDELLSAFRTFSEEHHSRKGLSIHLALKAGQVIGKLQRTFKKDELEHIIDPTLMLRTERLLSDYITMFRGFTPPREISIADLPSLVEALVEGLSIPALSEEDVISSADDEKAFARILLASIGMRPLLEEVDFSLENAPCPIPVAIDRDHFTDLLTYILEDLVGTGSGTIRIAVHSGHSEVCIIVSGTTPSVGSKEKQRGLRFLSGLCERAGGVLTFCQDEDGMRYTISITRVI